MGGGGGGGRGVEVGGGLNAGVSVDLRRKNVSADLSTLSISFSVCGAAEQGCS